MKKLKRIMMSIVCLICFCFNSTSCWFWGGYNEIMYEYFKDEVNYKEFTMSVYDFIWMDYDENVAYSLYENSPRYEYKTLEKREYDYIYLLLCVAEEDSAYWGEGVGEIAFRLIYNNAQEIIQNGGLQNIQMDDLVTIRATDWTYSDTRFLDIAYLESGDVCYLDLETGLNNIVAYMDENRSLL